MTDTKSKLTQREIDALSQAMSVNEIKQLQIVLGRELAARELERKKILQQQRDAARLKVCQFIRLLALRNIPASRGPDVNIRVT